MKTQYFTATSLDGFLADENHSLDWLFQFNGPDEGSFTDFIAGVGGMVMGSATYEWVLRNHINTNPPHAWPHQGPAWVFSSRELPTVPGADIRFARGDVRAVYEAAARELGDRNLWLAGGGDLVGQFHDHGLLDELIIGVAPVTLGRGAPLLPRRIAFPPLELTSCTPRANGMVELRYRVRRAEPAALEASAQPEG